MLSFVPELRALWERGRRPARMFAIGVGLATPASAFIMRQDAAQAADGVVASTPAAPVAVSATERQAALSTLRMAQLFDVPLGVATQIHVAAESAGIPPRLAFGLVRTESRFKRTAVSPVGAVGYTQVMPATARWLEPGTTRGDLFEGSTNLRLGFRYLKKLMDVYDGDVRLALTAYNRGPGTVDRLLKRGRDPENGYADMVLADPMRLKADAASVRVASSAPARSTVKKAGRRVTATGASVRRGRSSRASVSRHRSRTSSASVSRHRSRTSSASASRHRSGMSKASATRHHASAKRATSHRNRATVHSARRKSGRSTARPRIAHQS
ncbi:MAG TPA: transglycosylase SLT domain-containing protein [Longimicrobiales bacterium]|nr:transglycosylase SLT domain-containing protein [Longimicrobiales bacterium]